MGLRKNNVPPPQSFTLSPIHPSNFPSNHPNLDNFFRCTSSTFTSVTMGFTDFLSDAGLNREFLSCNEWRGHLLRGAGV
jgi:hypothetical protein